MIGNVAITGRGGTRAVALSAYLDPQAEERAQAAARDWIKGLRAARHQVGDGV